MKNRRLVFLAAFVLTLLAVSAVLAASEELSMRWWSIDGGGGASRGAGYYLSSSIGQAEAGRQSGGGYVLQGGFWGKLPTTPVPERSTFLPLVLR